MLKCTIFFKDCQNLQLSLDIGQKEAHGIIGPWAVNTHESNKSKIAATDLAGFREY